jgi:hypothetical protein
MARPGHHAPLTDHVDAAVTINNPARLGALRTSQPGLGLLPQTDPQPDVEDAADPTMSAARQ